MATKQHEGIAIARDGEKGPAYDVPEHDEVGNLEVIDGLHRRLSNRQIQWIAIGGSIGTALFVSIGWGLVEGGPGSLFIAFAGYCFILALANSCMAEMSVFMPVVGGWVRMGSKWVDEAYGFMAGWNFFLYEAVLIPFEISALNLVLTYWRDDIPVAAVVAACIVLYGIINLFAVRAYGESEFWLASGKVLLIFMLFAFTFVTMVGGNPKHDAYGFRYWRTPGSFATYIHSGSLGRFEGFLGAFFQASFTCVGPEYVAMVAGEAIYPRKTIKMAYKTMYFRFGLFFILGALCVGIILPYDDPTLNNLLLTEGTGTGASSPYVIAMRNMGISVLPDLTNALMVTSIFSAGNSYVYCATRTLYSLSIDGHAPRFLQKTTRAGVPIYCFCVTMFFPLLAFLSVGHAASEGVKWLANITQAAQLMDYIIMCTTYLFFYRALQAQGISRDSLPYKGWGQPYVAIAGVVLFSVILAIYGYATFYAFDVGTFFTYYAMCFVCIILWVGFKLVKRSKFVRPEDADLVWERPRIDAYEANPLLHSSRKRCAALRCAALPHPTDYQPPCHL
ncbi:amino acid transporter-like protein [Trematosphaeria pertusa]|uniref:Amino acid transporter-like protein n=1 Tax=Trematosphaeria pertusa TaxID=390896 RepID=A0A6A6ID85_9PLEO|nr:amino acid transporter-like protein [Trematosphaeria pertusa]KAF2247463.1 amino acid transporter-like protein [Trematosphaeria pertusa]